MFKYTHLLLIVSVLSLNGCSTVTDNSDYYKSANYIYTPLYPEGYESGGNFNPKPEVESNVVVPQTYHLSANQSPISPKDLDHSWISNQNPQFYTITLARAENPLVVGSAMSKAPRNERMAEIKYQQNGKLQYEGFYGTYASQELAEEALKSLPSDLQQSASLTTWSSVQQRL